MGHTILNDTKGLFNFTPTARLDADLQILRNNESYYAFLKIMPANCRMKNSSKAENSFVLCTSILNRAMAMKVLNVHNRGLEHNLSQRKSF